MSSWRLVWNIWFLSANEINSKSGLIISSPTAYEFTSAWTSLKQTKDLSVYAQLLRQVPPSRIATVLSNKLEADMLETIILCLNEHFTLCMQWDIAGAPQLGQKENSCFKKGFVFLFFYSALAIRWTFWARDWLERKQNNFGSVAGAQLRNLPAVEESCFPNGSGGNLWANIFKTSFLSIASANSSSNLNYRKDRQFLFIQTFHCRNLWRNTS